MKLVKTQKIELCFTCRRYTNWKRVYNDDIPRPCWKCKHCGLEYLIELDRKVTE